MTSVRGVRHDGAHCAASAIGPEATQRLRDRVVAELKTTFASHYTQVVSLTEALDMRNIAAYAKRATGEKFLIDPSRG